MRSEPATFLDRYVSSLRLSASIIRDVFSHIRRAINFRPDCIHASEVKHPTHSAEVYRNLFCVHWGSGGSAELYLSMFVGWVRTGPGARILIS